MSELSLTTIRVLKKKREEEILGLIKEFQRVTGVKVEAISYMGPTNIRDDYHIQLRLGDI